VFLCLLGMKYVSGYRGGVSKMNVLEIDKKKEFYFQEEKINEM